MTSITQPSIKKILVIDDEIEGISLDSALIVLEELSKQLSDPTSPIAEEINIIIEQNFPSFSNFYENHSLSIDFIKNVLLTPLFIELSSHDLKTHINRLIEQNNFLLKTKEKIQEVFPETEYVITFLEHYSEAAELKFEEFDLLILDWYLNATTTNEKFISETLSKIPNLPPILLLTSYNKIDTPAERSRFFKSTRISGAGLITLTKDKFLSSNSNFSGLLKICSMLSNQRVIANDIRRYITDWENALEIAKNKTLEALWQLDTFIIKSIQEDAVIDGQPYHDHFHNFIERENSWYLENEFTKKSNIESLGKSLEDLTYSDILMHHTNENSISLHRTLLSHYSFKGYTNILAIQSKSIQDLKKSILHDIPFGAVLKTKSITDPVESIYINITQPCDLSDIVRSSKGSDRSIQLIKMEATKKGLNESTIFDTNNYIITDFNINDEFYDLKPLPMSIISLNFEDFYKFSCEKELHVIGGVRNDIAVGLQQKAVSYLIRPSQQRTQRPSINLAKIVYLKHCETGHFDENQRPLFDHFGTVYTVPTNIVGTKNQTTTKQFIQFIGLNQFELIEWIISNIQNKNIRREDLIKFFYEQIEIGDKISEKKIDSLTIKLKKIDFNQPIEDEISKLRINKKCECIFILH
ncbi:hypothetical protein [Acinetobacter pragensis]|uniref:Response receiver domain-containing protein n=1 Tax=Acinetobacter pragensis TaxID=1806892 RepID=A0A151Y0A8_9GAMM|nr:hypothetical protein [Acinetobacter pragensis]KYQ71477.1 hypothetical protein AZH43_14095 [Acinetobacter pragensis]